MIKHFIFGVTLLVFYGFFSSKNRPENCGDIQFKLKKALEDKIEATQESVKMAKMCQHSEAKYINLLLKMEELHSSLKIKSEKLTEYMKENQDLKEENALLNQLIQN